MRFLKLRIAWPVGCAIACVLLIALWVRSESLYDAVSWRSVKGMYYSLMSQCGHLTVVNGYNPNDYSSGTHFEIGHKALNPFVDSPAEPTLSGILGLRWYSSLPISRSPKCPTSSTPASLPADSIPVDRATSPRSASSSANLRSSTSRLRRGDWQ